MRILSTLLIAFALYVPATGLAQEHSASGKRVLVICTGNSARSQMAAGFLHSFDPTLQIYSAGTAPAPRINPFAVQVMKEVGIDISAGVPKNVRKFLGDSFDFVVTVCDDADKNCPVFQGKVGKRLHIGFPDPAAATGTDEQKLVVFRRVRDDIRTRFLEFYKKQVSAHS